MPHRPAVSTAKLLTCQLLLTCHFLLVIRGDTGPGFQSAS